MIQNRKKADSVVFRMLSAAFSVFCCPIFQILADFLFGHPASAAVFHIAERLLIQGNSRLIFCVYVSYFTMNAAKRELISASYSINSISALQKIFCECLTCKLYGYNNKRKTI